MKILVTAARAPVAVEWARILRRSGHETLLCDSLRFPLGRFAPQWALFASTPAPRLDFPGYQKAMTPLIEAADLVIPTCEDIFHLARLPLADAVRARCLMPPNPLLFGLHHKLEVFSLMPKNTAIAFPKTRLVTDPAELVPDAAGRRTVLKPVFSRFGRSVIRGVAAEHRRTLPASPGYPWVQQRFVEGEPLCNYALCVHGELIAHAAYRPRYLLNGAAASYIAPVEDRRLEDFVRAFARLHGYHGQAAFDFIDDGERLWLLECNPRATSGLHLLRNRLRCDEEGRFFLTEGPVAPAASCAAYFSDRSVFDVRLIGSRRNA